jgi:hypothetical protein
MSSEKFNVSVGQKTTVKISEGQTLVSKVVIGTPIRSIDQARFDAATLNRLPGSHYLDWNNFTNVPDKAILERIDEIEESAAGDGIFGAGLKLNGTIRVAGSIIPDSNERYNLGTPNYRWGSLYVKGNTIFVGGLSISDAGTGQLTISSIVFDPSGEPSVDSDGDIITFGAQIVGYSDEPEADLITDIPNQIVDEYDATVYRTSKYVIQVEHDSDNKYQTSELLLTHNGTDVFLTEFAVVQAQDSSIAEFTATMATGAADSAIITLLMSPVYTNTSFKSKRFSINS